MRKPIFNSRKEAGALIDLGYKAIFDLLPCYLSVQDPSFQILQINQTFRNDFGDAVGKKCYEAYKNRPDRCPSCPVAKTFTDKKIHIGEETVRFSNGETAQMIVFSSPILDAFGNVVAVIEMSTNISKVKEMRKELEFLGQSIATLSHDIKNILEGLQGGAYVVDEGLKDGDEELIGKGWDIVKKNITEVSTLVQNILYSSKKRAPTYEQVALEELAREVAGLFHEKARSMKIQLKQQLNPKLPMVRLDPPAIRRMLSNLIWNALEACLKDKEKPVHNVVVRADFYDDHHVMFEVEDNGTGMGESTRDKLFTEFFSTKGTDGTGLGLLVVQKIVKAHGGKIEVLTAPGKGSTFRVIFEMGQPEGSKERRSYIKQSKRGMNKRPAK